ncbi:ABC transporter ATP-binding protein [Spirochaeta dissipatitropha]
MALLRLEQAEKTYGQGQASCKALNGVSLQLEAGDMLAITGPSGSGKSTLLNILGMLDSADAGSYELNGKQLSELSFEKQRELRVQTIGFVIQFFALLERYTVYKNIELPLKYAGISGKERKERVQQAVVRLGIEDKLYSYPNQLSIGQVQRAAIARAIVSKPLLILADEPTGSLDSRNGDRVIEIFHELNAAGTAVVMVTHNEHLAEGFPRRIHLVDGRVAD